MGRVYVQIFFRTFAQLALAVLLSVQGLSWATSHDARVNATTLGLGLLGAAVGALIAVLWAIVASPATTPLEKAIRSALQIAAAGLGALAFNTAADLVAVGPAIVAIVVGMVFAFAVTYLQNVPAPQPPG